MKTTKTKEVKNFCGLCGIQIPNGNIVCLICEDHADEISQDKYYITLIKLFKEARKEVHL